MRRAVLSPPRRCGAKEPVGPPQAVRAGEEDVVVTRTLSYGNGERITGGIDAVVRQGHGLASVHSAAKITMQATHHPMGIRPAGRDRDLTFAEGCTRTDPKI